MIMDDYDGQMIFGDLGGLKLPDICLTGEEKKTENLTQEICPDRGSNPGPLRDMHVCYPLLHGGGPFCLISGPFLEYFLPFLCKFSNFIILTIFFLILGQINFLRPENPQILDIVKVSKIHS